MGECVCNSCKHLKSVVNEKDLEKSGSVEEYSCEFGFPSEDCLVCEAEGCELSCDNYSMITEDEIVITKCAKCGKELKQLQNSADDGEVYCITCYLEK